MRLSDDLLLARQRLRTHLRAVDVAGLARLGQLRLDARQATCAVCLQALGFGARTLDPAHALLAHAQVGLPQPLRQDESQHQEQPQHDEDGAVDVEELLLRGLRHATQVRGNFEKTAKCRHDF